MVVIDTNILIRFLTRDDEDQAERARALISTEPTLLLMTVALEAEWVLRSMFRLSKREVVAQLRAFSQLPLVSVEDLERLHAALDLTEVGSDFADALHLAAIKPGDTLATFDAAFAKAAKRAKGIEVRQL